MKIESVIDETMYRDGGSIGVVYKILDNQDYNELVIKVSSINSLSKYDPNKYNHARINRRWNTIYKCPLTGSEIPDYKTSSASIDWPEARILINEIVNVADKSASKFINHCQIIKSIIQNKCAK